MLSNSVRPVGIKMFENYHRSLINLVFVLCLALFLPATSAKDIRLLNTLLDTVLNAHVKDGYVDYPGLKQNSRFQKYLTLLESFDPSTLETKDHQAAFWINTYNSLALKMVINGTTPVNAVGRMKFYRTTEHKVGKRKYDLNSIKSILQEFEDPRVLFAIVDASYAAPVLKNEIYRPMTINQELDAAAFAFVNDNRKNRFLPNLRIAKLSKIFERNESMFGQSEADVLNWISEYHENEDVADDLMDGRFKVDYLDYEYSINGRPL